MLTELRPREFESICAMVTSSNSQAQIPTDVSMASAGVHGHSTHHLHVKQVTQHSKGGMMAPGASHALITGPINS